MAVPLTLSSVPAQTPYVQYVATSGQTVFPYPFEITQDSDLIVAVNAVQLGTDVGYTLSGQGNSTGGFLTFTLGQTAGAVVTIYREITISRVTQLANNGTFFASNFNNEFNRIYLILQQLQEANSFVLQIPNTNNPAPTTILSKTAYANSYLSFDSNGNPQPAVLTSSGTITASLLNGLLFPQTTAEQLAGITPVNLYVPHHTAIGEILTSRYGTNTTPGSSDMTSAINNAMAVAKQLVSTGAGNARVHINGSNFHSGSIQLFQGIEVYGDGYPVQTLVKSADFETFNTATTGSIIGMHVHDISVVNTLSGVTAKYDIHLTNVNFARIERLHCTNTASGPTNYSSTNTGGLWFDVQNGGTSECNWVNEPFIQNNSVWFGAGVTDSQLVGGFVWGSNRNFAVRIDGGNISVVGMLGIIPSQTNGGVYITSTASDPKICNNFFDGGQPGVTTGVGLNVSTVNGGICVGNNFFNCWKQGVLLSDCSRWAFSANKYENCNRANSSYDDVAIAASAAAKGNRFVGETHINTSATSKGYPYSEINVGASPTLNYFDAFTIDDSSSGYAGGAGVALNKAAGSTSGQLGSVQESTFVPVLAGTSAAGSNTYSTQAGTFKVVGNVLFFELSVACSGVSGMTGNLTITGLPVAAALGTASVTIGSKAGVTTTYANLHATISSGATNISLWTDDSTHDSTAVPASDAGSAAAFNVSGFYFIA